MPSFISRYFSLITAVVLSTLSLTALIINSIFYKYPGNNYFPPGMAYIGFILIAVLLGVHLLFGKDSHFSRIIREFIYFFLVVTVIAFATNAVQYTPFPPIDRQLIAIEAKFHIYLDDIIAWTASYPRFKLILALAYDSLPFQIAYLPLIVILARHFYYVREFFALMLISVLIGFIFYYFFPTMGPASFIESPYFLLQQYATGQKFTEIHQYIPPTTLDGGMIAMPSFHTIWAWFCLYLSRCLRPVFFILLPNNILIIASCVLIGWHYPIDLIGSLIIILISHALYHYVVIKPQKEAQSSAIKSKNLHLI